MRLLTVLATNALMCFAVSGAQASIITLNQSQLGDLEVAFKTPDNPVTGIIFNKILVGEAVEFEVSLKDTDGPPLVADVGVGLRPVGLGLSSDMSSYSGFGLKFTNTNNSTWSVAPYIKTAGATSDNYYQAPLTTLLVGDSAEMVLDFASLGVTNLGQVTEMGFVVSGIMNNVPPNPSNGDIAHITVSQHIPEPGLLSVLALGGLGMLTRRRK